MSKFTPRMELKLLMLAAKGLAMKADRAEITLGTKAC
jgi:hypothetical protein